MSFSHEQVDPGNYDNGCDYEHELDSDIIMRETGDPSTLKYYCPDIMRSPSRRPRSIRYENLSPRRHESRNLIAINGEDDSYEEDEDQDYYPTSSDYSESEDDDLEDLEHCTHVGVLHFAVTATEKILILSTFIGTALGIVIGYVLLLSDNEQNAVW